VLAYRLVAVEQGQRAPVVAAEAAPVEVRREGEHLRGRGHGRREPLAGGGGPERLRGQGRRAVAVLGFEHGAGGNGHVVARNPVAVAPGAGEQRRVGGRRLGGPGGP